MYSKSIIQLLFTSSDRRVIVAETVIPAIPVSPTRSLDTLFVTEPAKQTIVAMTTLHLTGRLSTTLEHNDW